MSLGYVGSGYNLMDLKKEKRGGASLHPEKSRGVRRLVLGRPGNSFVAYLVMRNRTLDCQGPHKKRACADLEFSTSAIDARAQSCRCGP